MKVFNLFLTAACFFATSLMAEPESAFSVQARGVAATIKRDKSYFYAPDHKKPLAVGIFTEGSYRFLKRNCITISVMNLESSTRESVYRLICDSIYRNFESEVYFSRDYSLPSGIEYRPFLGLHYGFQNTSLNPISNKNRDIFGKFVEAEERWLGPIAGVFASKDFLNGIAIHSRLCIKGNLSREGSFQEPVFEYWYNFKRGNQLGADALVGAAYKMSWGKNEYNLGGDVFSYYHGDSVLIIGMKAGLSILF